MAELMRMPEVLAGSTEAVVQGWSVPIGQEFAAGDVIATVETEKAVVDVEAERDGVLLRVLVPDGASVDVGAPIAVIGERGETVAAADALAAGWGIDAPEPPGTPEPPETRAAAPQPDPASQSQSQSQSQPQPQPVPVSAPAPVPEPGPAGRVLASPLARRLARENGLAVERIDGSGPYGRIVRRDVEAAIAAAGAAVPDGPESDGPVRDGSAPAGPIRDRSVTDGSAFVDEPHSRIRRAVARRLTASKQEAPHFYLRATCRVDRLLELRREINEHAPVRVSVNDLVIKAAARAHTLVPELNVIWTGDAVRRFTSVDVSVAIATDRGLLTPVVRRADELSLTALAAAVRDLRDRGERGRLRQDELEGGALSVTNLGMFGTEEFTAILNPPQSAILAVGAARQEAVVEDGRLVAATVMRVTLSVDHRPVDGVVAARWLQAFVRSVEHPLTLLI
ncbi:dihydrolipoamide acetyltransferase family protein [Streptosporangium sp. NPDC051022]|uniref:dihydrolipoamide acetyltransferase family protein n=1 Tax=Streptosporangium sp. NPDC051022 TaxID=3155752 RepID=UPI0034301314